MSLDQHGQIEEKDLESGVLVNRMTADWYLPMLRARSEWKLGFLAVVADEDEAARGHFDQALAQDRLLQRAVGMEVFNAYDRLLKSLDNNVFVGKEEDMEGLRGKVRLAMHWADFHFMLENFGLAKDLYRRMQKAAKEEKDVNALIRATVGEALVKNAERDPKRHEDTPRLYALAMEHPKAPATPFLLWHCGVITRKGQVTRRVIYDQLIENYPRSRHGVEARYSEILLLPYESHEARRAMTAQFKRDYPDQTAYHDYLDRWELSLMEYFRELPRIKAEIERKIREGDY